MNLTQEGCTRVRSINLEFGIRLSILLNADKDQEPRDEMGGHRAFQMHTDI
jgi:hypothetical protein